MLVRKAPTRSPEPETPTRDDRTSDGAFALAFRRVFDAQFPSLFRYLDRLSGDPALAADLAQDAFVRLFRRGAMPDDVRAWLATVASNLFRDERRRAARRGRLLAVRRAELTLADPPQAREEAEVIAKERRAQVRRALDRLSPRDRQLLLLRHEGYRYRELARVVGVAESSVGTLLVRATEAFRAAFPEGPHASD